MRSRKEIEIEIKKTDFNWRGRARFISNFSNYLLEETESKHICISGVWGSGKTTTILGVKNYITDQKQGKNLPLILYLDAWKYEHYNHPLFSLLKVMEVEYPQIIKAIGEEFKKSYSLQLGINVPIFNISTSLKNESPQKQVLNTSEYIDVLNMLMLEAIKIYKKEQANSLIIFIDELDRAKPDFALSMIEMFHHLRDELKTHIIYSVDMGQLNSMIRHYYGYEYNVNIFTHKVFDVTIPLKKLSEYEIEEYIKHVLRGSEHKYSTDRLTSIIISSMSIEQADSLRTINTICEKVVNNLSKGYFAQSRENNYSSYYLGGKKGKYV